MHTVPKTNVENVWSKNNFSYLVRIFDLRIALGLQKQTHTLRVAILCGVNQRISTELYMKSTINKFKRFELKTKCIGENSKRF
jgi:hypothetical protein